MGNFASKTPTIAAPIGEKIAEQVPAIATAVHYRQLETLTDGDRWQRALNPTYVGEVDATELAQGAGTKAGCGSKVTLRLRGTLSDGANFNPNHHETTPLTFIVGQAPYKALNEGVVGMQKGSVRQLRAAPREVFDDNPPSMDSVIFRLELDAVSPTTPASELPFILTRVVAPLGEDDAARCGAPVTLKLVWYDAKGKAAKTETREITLGKHQLGVGIDRAAHGMVLGESRVAVLPPLWQKHGTTTQTVLLTRVEK